MAVTGPTGPIPPLSPEKANLAWRLRHQHIMNQFIGTAFDDSLTLDMRIRALQQIILDNLIQMQGPEGPQGQPGQDAYGIPVNAVDYGADPTGTSDSAAGINAAVEYVKNNTGKGVVYLPAGTYIITSTINLADGVSLIGLENPTILRRFPLGTMGGMLNNGIQPGATGYNGNSNITISGITFDMDGNNTEFPMTAGVGITLAHARDILIDNCNFNRTKGFRPIDLNGCQGVTIQNCWFNGFVVSGDATIDSFAREAIQVGPAQFDNSNSGASDYTPCDSIIIKDNKFINTYPDFSDFLVAIGNHFSREGVIDTNILIKGNTIRTTLRGINPFKWQNVRIEGNSITVPNSLGILFSNVGGGTFESSLDLQGNQTGITRNSIDVIIDSNTFYDCQRAIQGNGRAFQPPGGNIQFVGVQNCIISNNLIVNNQTGDNGQITMTCPTNLAIVGNVFRTRNQNLNRCISLGGANNYIISSNDGDACNNQSIMSTHFNGTTFEEATQTLRGRRGIIANNVGISSNLNAIHVQQSDNVKISSNSIQRFAVTEDTVTRGGVFLEGVAYGMVDNNMIIPDGTSSTLSVKVLISSGSSNSNTFNNAGVLRNVVNDTANNNFVGAWDAPTTVTTSEDLTITTETTAINNYSMDDIDNTLNSYTGIE